MLRLPSVEVPKAEALAPVSELIVHEPNEVLPVLLLYWLYGPPVASSSVR